MFSIYNNYLELKMHVKNYTSLRWRRKYFSPGEFEIHMPTTDIVHRIQVDDIVNRKYSRESGVIESISITDEETVLYGRFLSSYLERRITYGINRVKASSEAVMHKMVNDNSILSRPLPLLQLGALIGYDDQIEMQYSWKNVLSTVEKISRKSNLGFGIFSDVPLRTMYFEVFQGKDRSIDQKANKRAIFSVERNNLRKSEYTTSQLTYKNVGIIGGEGDGELRTIVKVNDDEIGFNRREIFIDARDLQKDEEQTTEEYETLLIERGYEKLAENTMFESFECDIDLEGNLVYKTDFDLGDIVTCIRKDWGKIVNVRITEIEESIEGDNVNLTAILGSPLPSNENIREEE